MRSFIASALAPITSTRPASGEMIDMIMRIVVLLPAPLGPRKPQSERSGISSEIPLTACTLPKRFSTCSRRTASAPREVGEAEGDMGAECSRARSPADKAITPLLRLFAKSQQRHVHASGKKVGRRVPRGSQSQLRSLGDAGAAGTAGTAGLVDAGGFAVAGSMPLGARIASGVSVSTATVE